MSHDATNWARAQGLPVTAPSRPILVRVEIGAYVDGDGERTEAVWINPACWSALTIERGGHSAGQGTPLFSIAGGMA
ncbi:hypothetical protein [Rhizobium leguminosarum]|jgi:hypothetical protein|uniref:hypothetical protein n=1 Tax=Rhizobium leguminosarum TaxID=384 RepID=UPI0035156628